MPSTAPLPHPRHHLAAASTALAVLLAFATGLTFLGRAMERQQLDRLLPLFADSNEHDEADRGAVSYLEHLKNQGIALQRRVFEQRDLLPLYGSSELMKPIPDKANLFFRHYPTGFAVVPVGKAGTTSLIMLQKLGALGGANEGRRVALSLSPSWFLRDALADHPYEGNFSRPQAFATLLNPRLGLELKRELARRMLLRPRTVEHDALLLFLTRHLARGAALDRALYRAVWPLAQVQRALAATQDHFEVVTSLWRNTRRLPAAPEHRPAALDWERLLADAAQAATGTGSPMSATARSRPNADATFREELASSPEWLDFELLLRGLEKMGIRTLVLCVPNNATYYQRIGVTQASLDLFTTKLRAVSTRHGAQVEAFEEYESDVDFMVEHTDHLTVKGWMHYNRALDEFYHASIAPLESALAKGRPKRPHHAS